MGQGGRKSQKKVGFNIFTDLQPTLQLIQNLFITQKTPYPEQSLPRPPNLSLPSQPLNYSLVLLYICLLWTLHVNGTMKHIVFCDDFFHLACFFKVHPLIWSMYQQFILFIAKVFRLYGYTTFIYQFISRQTFGLFPLSGDYK